VCSCAFDHPTTVVLHSGHDGFFLTHCRIHAWWNVCAHASVAELSPSSMSSKQMQHPVSSVLSTTRDGTRGVRLSPPLRPAPPPSFPSPCPPPRPPPRRSPPRRSPLYESVEAQSWGSFNGSISTGRSTRARYCWSTVEDAPLEAAGRAERAVLEDADDVDSAAPPVRLRGTLTPTLAEPLRDDVLAVPPLPTPAPPPTPSPPSLPHSVQRPR
jgi:hypothetical protein